MGQRGAGSCPRSRSRARRRRRSARSCACAIRDMAVSTSSGSSRPASSPAPAVPRPRAPRARAGWRTGRAYLGRRRIGSSTAVMSPSCRGVTPSSGVPSTDRGSVRRARASPAYRVRRRSVAAPRPRAACGPRCPRRTDPFQRRSEGASSIFELERTGGRAARSPGDDRPQARSGDRCAAQASGFSMVT